MTVLLIDNYDSFVYNLARYVSEIGFTYQVKRNDAITLEEINYLNPSHIIISPGPCTPDQAGISMDVIRQWGPSIPLLGVCLGHQAIGQVYGANVVHAKYPMHGKPSFITHTQDALFKKLPSPMQVGRYHSLIISEDHFPSELMITARCEMNEIMALQHRCFPIWGVQFHPESVLTQQGHMLLKNFLDLKPSSWPQCH